MSRINNGLDFLESVHYCIPGRYESEEESELAQKVRNALVETIEAMKKLKKYYEK